MLIWRLASSLIFSGLSSSVMINLSREATAGEMALKEALLSMKTSTEVS
jgi:hypothetical protein